MTPKARLERAIRRHNNSMLLRALADRAIEDARTELAAARAAVLEAEDVEHVHRAEATSLTKQCAERRV